MADQNNDKRTGRARTFVAEVKDEARRITWPTREKSRQDVVVVLMLTAVMSCFIGIIDVVLAQVYRIFL